jgi:hypothetical protein
MFKKWLEKISDFFRGLFGKKEKEEEKPQFIETDHGYEIEWVVPEGHENAGKRILVWSDGYHKDTADSTFKAVDGLTDWFADRSKKWEGGDAEEMPISRR